MLFAACEDEIHIRQKLDIRAQQCLDTFFGIFGDLLEFDDRNITTFVSRLQIIEYLLERRLLRCRSNIDRRLGQSVQFIERKNRAATLDELRETAQRLLRDSIQLPQ